MIAKLPFEPSSCYHDYSFYAVFYGEAFLFEDFIYYYDGRDVRIIGYDRRGHPIDEATLQELFSNVLGKWRVRSISLECPSLLRVRGSAGPFSRQVVWRPSPKYDHELVLKGKPSVSREISRSLRRAENSGLRVQFMPNHDLSFQHYLLLERYIKRWEPCPYLKAEFVASLFHLLGRRRSVMANCLRGDELCGFAVGTLLGDFGVLHMTITLNGAHGISDLLYHSILGSMRNLGARSVSLGFSLHKGLLRFKEKWGGRRTWAGGCEILWYRNENVPRYLWATRIARLGS